MRSTSIVPKASAQGSTPRLPSSLVRARASAARMLILTRAVPSSTDRAPCRRLSLSAQVAAFVPLPVLPSAAAPRDPSRYRATPCGAQVPFCKKSTNKSGAGLARRSLSDASKSRDRANQEAAPSASASAPAGAGATPPRTSPPPLPPPTSPAAAAPAPAAAITLLL